MERLASRHPTNGCSPFAGTLPHLGFNAPSARVEAARSSIHHSFQKQKIPTRQPHPRPSGPPAQVRRHKRFGRRPKPWRRADSFRPELILIGFQKEKSQPSGWDFSFWSGRRGSNSLPPPWQGGALPDELRPRNIGYFNKSAETCQYVFPNFRFFYFAASSAAPQVISRMQPSPSCTPAG